MISSWLTVPQKDFCSVRTSVRTVTCPAGTTSVATFGPFGVEHDDHFLPGTEFVGDHFSADQAADRPVGCGDALTRSSVDDLLRDFLR